MLLWIILVLGWVSVLMLAIFVFRAFGYAERKVRRLTPRPRPSQEEKVGMKAA